GAFDHATDDDHFLGRSRALRLGSDAVRRKPEHSGHGHARVLDLRVDSDRRFVDRLLRSSFAVRETGQESFTVIVIAILVFLGLLFLGVPVAFSIGAAGLGGLAWHGGFPLIVIIQQIHQSVDSFVLLAIPLFVFAGMLMETGGIAIRLVHLAQALIGWIRGGLAMAVVVAEYIFSGISGSTIADVSAIGGTLIPPMVPAGHPPPPPLPLLPPPPPPRTLRPP